MNKPAKNIYTVLFFSFFVSSCILAYCNYLSKIIAILSAVVIALFILIKRHVKKIGDTSRVIAIILAGTAVGGILSVYAFNYRADGIDKCAGKNDNVTLRIVDCDYSLSYVARYNAVIEDSDFIEPGTGLLLTSEQINLKNGTILSGEVVYSSLSEMNSSSFDAARYYLPKKIMICADDASLEIVGIDETFSISGMFNDINESLAAKITAHADSSGGGLQSAVLLGNKDYLSDSTVRDFRRLGVSHLLVVSGMHFAVIASFVERSLRRFRINKRYRAILNIMFILFFMALFGFTPSVTRAGIMCLIAQLAQIISRKANQLNSLALAGCLMIIANPYLAVDCGMQLSFIATYSCIVFVKYKSYFILKSRALKRKRPKSRKIARVLRSITETIVLTLFVNIAMLPVMFLYFGEISLMAIPANIVFIPMITILMYLSGIYLLLYPLRIFIIPLSTFTGWYCDLIEKIANMMSQPKYSVISINYDWVIYFIIPLCIFIIAFPYVNKKYIRRISVFALSTILALGLAVCIANCSDYNKVQISYISEKKNDGLVIKSNGKIMLCDFSDASFGFGNELLEEMTLLHSTEVEAVLFTHYHSKHVQLFNRITEREIVRSLILTEPINDSEYLIYDSLYKSALEKGVRVYSMSADEPFEFGDCEITVFERKYISRSTHPITAVKISAHDEMFTYASSSFNQSTEEITDSVEISDYIILGRHSPVYKKEFSLEFDELPESIVVCSDAYEHMSEITKENIDSSKLLIDVETYRIIIENKE